MRCFSALLLTVALVCGAADTSQVREWYYKAVDGDRQAARNAAAALTGLLASGLATPVQRAFAGSLRVLESGHTFAPWKKGKLAKEGLLELESAVAAAPNDLEVRFVRAMSTFHLPSFFKREEQSAADFKLLATAAPQAVATGKLEPRIAASALYHHGIFLERKGDKTGAEEAWKAAAQIAPQSRAAAEAQRRLRSS